MKLAAAATALLVFSAGCGSTSSKSASTSPAHGSVSSGHTLTVGVLTDLTGLASTNDHFFPSGVSAGVALAAAEGYNIKFVVADTASSPAQALAAAQKLVDQDHAFAILTLSALAFAAAPWLTSKGIPVIGAAEDGTEWTSSRNMFSVFGTSDYTKVYSQYGLIFKQLGATNIASIGYGISPSSAESAKSTAVSAQLAGLKVGYLNAQFPFGTNVGPAALAIKAAGSDGLNAAIETNTEFALIDALRQEGVDLKAALVSTGYGADLYQGGPAAERTAQGLYMPLSWEPVELHTAATEKFVHYLKVGAGVSVDPSYGQYIGYMSVQALVQGLQAAGSNPTRAALINGLLGITHFDGAGLYGAHSVGFAMDQRGLVSGADNCLYVVRYAGTTFHLISGMEPICGQTVPGKSVSSA